MKLSLLVLSFTLFSSLAFAYVEDQTEINYDSVIQAIIEAEELQEQSEGEERDELELDRHLESFILAHHTDEHTIESYPDHNLCLRLQNINPDYVNPNRRQDVEIFIFSRCFGYDRYLRYFRRSI